MPYGKPCLLFTFFPHSSVLRLFSLLPLPRSGLGNSEWNSGVVGYELGYELPGEDAPSRILALLWPCCWKPLVEAPAGSAQHCLRCEALIYFLLFE